MRATSPVVRFLAIALTVFAFLNGCSIGYVLRQGCEQLKIATGSVPVSEVLDTQKLTEEAKDKIRFILEVKKFAEEKIGVRKTENYTWYYNVGRDVLAYQLSGCKRECFEPYIWTFLIIGDVPYKAFFRREDALEEKKELEAQGYDTTVKIVGAYNTLGWFIDPIFSTMLYSSKPHLAELIIHELTHGTVYVKGNAEFNESLASFVGKEGAMEFLQEKYGAESPEVMEYRNELHDEKLFEGFVEASYHELERLYQSAVCVEEKLERRKKLFEKMKGEAQELAKRFKSEDYRGIAGVKWNNAEILGARRYGRTETFERLFQREKRSWVRFWEHIKRVSKQENPLKYLEKEF